MPPRARSALDSAAHLALYLEKFEQLARLRPATALGRIATPAAHAALQDQAQRPNSTLLQHAIDRALGR